MIFDEKQLEAVVSPSSKVMVVAGPGSGKTTMLVGRVSHLLSQGVPADRILCLTFSKSMADSLAERVKTVGYDIEARTFHSFFLSLIREDPSLFGLPDNFDVDVSGSSLETVIRNSNYIIPDDESLAGFLKAREGSLGSSSINNQMILNGKIDFTMMASLVVDKMMNDFIFSSNLYDRFDHVLVDEYQDVNAVQQKFIELMGLASNLWIIGDDDQAIYEFRASAPSSLSDFETTWPKCFIVKTTRNYRSYDPIVSLCMKLISFNTNRFSKNVVSAPGVGASACVRSYIDENSEISSISGAVHKLIKEGCNPSEICILSRTNRLLGLFKSQVPDDVSLMTFHGSKGMEWKYVFVVGMSQGHSPSSLSSIQEERRLAFVALSRARLGLRVSFSVQSSGGSVQIAKSQFIDEAGLNFFTGVDRIMHTGHLNVTNSYIMPLGHNRPYGNSDAGLSIMNREIGRPERANLPWSRLDESKLRDLIQTNASMVDILHHLKRTRREVLRKCQKIGLSVSRAKLKQSA